MPVRVYLRVDSGCGEQEYSRVKDPESEKRIWHAKLLGQPALFCFTSNQADLDYCSSN